tara:strand:+ start:460 stop:576 length:117 start_codon:yes stop_codon:yes gene_type:complete
MRLKTKYEVRFLGKKEKNDYIINSRQYLLKYFAKYETH